MPFKKGQTTNPTGRPKGAISKVTKDQRDRAALIIDNNIDKMQGWIDAVAIENPERAYKMVLDMFEFSLPKLKAVEVTGKDGKDLFQPNITVQTEQGKKDLEKL